jgi:hypothetical protein
MRNGRPLYTEERVRMMFARMRGDLHAQHLRHLSEMIDLRRELERVRAAYNELRNAVLARQRGDAELAELYREREIERAQLTQRDPFTTQLH